MGKEESITDIFSEFYIYNSDYKGTSVNETSEGIGFFYLSMPELGEKIRQVVKMGKYEYFMMLW